MTGRLITSGQGKAKVALRDEVKNYVDEFINDYLTANPKK